jgi:hypothetical protein
MCEARNVCVAQPIVFSSAFGKRAALGQVVRMLQSSSLIDFRQTREDCHSECSWMAIESRSHSSEIITRPVMMSRKTSGLRRASIDEDPSPIYGTHVRRYAEGPILRLNYDTRDVVISFISQTALLIQPS